MSKTFLKIKIMSLAAEARIIRAEERKWPRERDIPKDQRDQPKQQARRQTREQLVSHRKIDVRREARSALLAYGFLRGRPYEKMEAKADTFPNDVRIVELAIKFGPVKDKRAVQGQLIDWLKPE